MDPVIAAILKKVELKWCKQFQRLLYTGQASLAFQKHLDKCRACQDLYEACDRRRWYLLTKWIELTARAEVYRYLLDRQ